MGKFRTQTVVVVVVVVGVHAPVAVAGAIPLPNGAHTRRIISYLFLISISFVLYY